MFLIGQGVGSLIAGPFSEVFDRNVVYAGSMAIFMIWIMACKLPARNFAHQNSQDNVMLKHFPCSGGLAPNFGAHIVFRFLAGCAASTPLVCSGGSVSDMFDSVEKTWGLPVYASFAFNGPMIGAVMGAYIGKWPSHTPVFLGISFTCKYAVT